MKLSGLLNRTNHELPGVTGVARVDRRASDLVRRVSPGDVAVMDLVDLDRRTAEALVAAEVVGVVNASPSISGRFPNLGPELLLEAGIPLIDDVGAVALREIKEGTKVRLHEGVVYAGERELAKGVEQNAESIADAMIEAKAGMSAQLEAFSANTIEFLRRERALVLDGVGVPEVYVSMRDRQVLVVAGGPSHAEELRKLRHYIREYRPVLIGVDTGADTLIDAGLKPDIIVGDPDGIGTASLRAAAEVVVPAQTDGHAPGLQRIQDLGIGAVTFPASGNAEDLALLLAEAHGASLVVTVGLRATLREFLDRGHSGSNPSTFLTRLKLGSKLVDGEAVATLHRSRVSLGVIVLLVAAAIAAMAAALAVSGVGHVYVDIVVDGWQSVVNWLKGFFS
ncbi:putative cytokinetic ring protein SteA [Lentzea sp. DG1S-22]|uniref:putative cytokinetic ring protein SteA n=1 Tax=unclassified Lentzea TaxID=2643253 RepID=UPI001F2DFA73|nr:MULTISPECIES: putative cytokinetic ring protein SteA [unclassified Lentzea]MCG8924623.1 putative cytokinetic ring protein SteA [Lentzea sp. CC55]WVH80739.1 putative cytokinetic ring protein SteA [Lentzea sp. DG1S-22]